ncbi:YicC/YloC family endoribonuclease [Leeia aquatica]|uniref:YicC family protein n=2 Tax=Leeia TaxID=650341 RepID=A0A847SB56_9NEIS|nr:YicC family protein [Leeia aquatica]
MIASMTGYASVTAETDLGMMTLELRAVNNRFLDAVFRMPEELRAFEPLLREALSGAISRGKVECRINLTARPDAQAALEVNDRMVSALLAAEQRVLAQAGGARGLSVSDILRWPGVMAATEVDNERLSRTLQQAMQQALQDFVASRKREGAKLADVLRERLEGIEALAQATRPKMPQLVQAYQQKLVERLQEVFGQADDQRIQQELALFAQKIDVDEELSRLGAHCSEVRRILKQGGVVGKRLDFMMQELQREANTLGSKAASLELTQTSVDMKVLVEQMREQVQNIE